MTQNDFANSGDSTFDLGQSMKSWSFALIVVLFVGSGFSSLIYQVVWTRLLVLVFGSTTLATSTVLAVFMGGLALGSWLCGRLVDKIGRPFFWYGILEGIIGLWALVIPGLFAAAVPLYQMVWQNFHLSFLPFSVLRFVIAAIVLLLPTSLMGATLPLLAKFVTSKLDCVGNRVGTLYAVNTLGAVAGCVAAGFWLLPSYGRQVSTLIAAGINFALCAVVIALAHKGESAPASYSREKMDKTPLPTSVKWCMVAFAFSGALAMIYEVGWTRALLMVIGSTTFAFSCMLSSFLVGIFAGSLICARFVDRAKQPLLWFAILQVLVFASGLASLSLFNYLPYLNVIINSWFPPNAFYSMVVRFLLSAAMLLPVALCLGAIFPVVVKACVRDLPVLGKSVGTLYSANTVGAIIGAFLAGFVLVPWLGVEKMLMAASACNLLIAVGIGCLLPNVSGTRKLAVVVAGLSLCGWCLQTPSIWDREVMLFAQTERRRMAYIKTDTSKMSYEQWRKMVDDHATVLFWRDGQSSSVGITQLKRLPVRSIITNGHVDGSDFYDMPVQVLLAGYPLLLKPDAEDVAIVGWGTGVMVGTTLKFPVKSVTAIELEPAVIEGSPFFARVNHSPEKDPRVRIEINDGRNYLLASPKKFDVIISEPSNPWQAGVCNLFTREYFATCKSRLKSGGLFSLWLQTNEIPPANIKGILRALQSNFPFCVGFVIDTGNVAIVASDQRIVLDYKKLQEVFANKTMVSDLNRVHVNTAENLLARIGITADSVNRLTGGVEPNVDDTNKLEFAVGHTYESLGYNAVNRQLFVFGGAEPWKAISFGNLDDKQTAKVMADVAQQAFLIARPPEAIWNWAKASLTVAENAEAYNVMAAVKTREKNIPEAFELWQKALQVDPQDTVTLMDRAQEYFALGQKSEAKADLLQVFKLNPENKLAAYYLAMLEAEESNKQASTPAATADHAKKVLAYLKPVTADLNFVRRHPDALSVAAVAHYHVGDLSAAEADLRRYVLFRPNSISAYQKMASLLFKRGANDEAYKWMAQAKEMQANAGGNGN